MAHGKDPSGQSEREKSDETRRDSDSASEHQADLTRDAERVEADKAKLQSRSDSDASRDFGRADVGRSGAKRQAEGDERLRVERQTSDQAIKGERLRTDAATEKGGAIIRHPPGLPPNYYRRNKRATKKPGRLLLPGKNSSLL
jgi:hypothetical protein